MFTPALPSSAYNSTFNPSNTAVAFPPVVTSESMENNEALFAHYADQAKLSVSDPAPYIRCGLMLMERLGCEENDRQAFDYLSQAAKIIEAAEGQAMDEQCLSIGQLYLQLGILYWNGRGTAQDYSKACSCYEKAAELGNAQASARLGMAYAQGLGVNLNTYYAFHYSLQAIDRGNPEGWIGMGVTHCVSSEPDDKDEYKAFRYTSAVSCYRLAADAGQADGWIFLGSMFMLGHGVTQNYQEAMACFHKASGITPFQAALRLEQLDHHTTAYAIYAELAKQRDAEAKVKCASMLMEGLGVARNYRQAFFYLMEAVQHKIPMAYLLLGDLYSHGHGIGWSQKDALACYKVAARLGIPAAYGRLGMEHVTDIGCYLDHDDSRKIVPVKAAKNSLQAIELGDSRGLIGMGNALGWVDGPHEPEFHLVMEYAQRGLQMLRLSPFSLDQEEYNNHLISLTEGYNELVECRKLRVELYLLAIAMGNPEGWCALGAMYEEKIYWGTTPVEKAKHYSQALACYNKAVEMGNWKGYLEAGGLCASEGRDLPKAYDYFDKAAELGYPIGLLQFGYEFLRKYANQYRESSSYFSDDADFVIYYSQVKAGLEKASKLGLPEASVMLNQLPSKNELTKYLKNKMDVEGPCT